MGFLTNLFTTRAANPSETRDFGEWQELVRKGARVVTPGSAMQIAAVLACTRVLAESISMLPLELRLRQARGSIAATAHPVYPLLHDLPNPDMTSIELRMALQGHLATWGNAYAQLVPDNAGRWLEIWPLRPDRMEVLRAPDDTLIYKYTVEVGAPPQFFLAWEILHIRGLSSDGLIGYSPIAVARRTFATKARMEEYQENFYENGARPGVVVKHPGRLTDKAYARLLSSWQERHQGPANANKVAILEEGMAVEDIGIPQSDAQFLESQKFTKNEIAALFRVPSHMINDLDRATFGNIEQMSLEFVIYSLMPWLVGWEQAISRSMLTPTERPRYYAKHKIQALLRGDNASRAQFYSTGLQWGYFSINDVRELDDLNPVGNGDTYFVPLNMVPLDQAVSAMAPQSPAAAAVRAVVDHDHGAQCTCGQHDHAPHATRADDHDDATEDLRLSRVELANAMKPVLLDIATRTVRRESRDIGKAVDKYLRKRSTEDFIQWLSDFYADYNNVVVDAFRAAMLAYARQAMLAAGAELGQKSKGLTDSLRTFVDEYLANLGNGWAASARTQLEIVLQEATANQVDPADAVIERLTRWEETKPAKVADRQAFEGLNAFVLASYGSYQITKYRWVASGTSCPFCRAMSGRTAGIEESILTEGTTLDGGDAGPMVIKRNVRHGPLHGGCDCVVMAVR